MTLLTYQDTFTLGVDDISDRVLSGKITFGGDPSNYQISWSTGEIVVENVDGRFNDVTSALLRVERPVVGSLAKRHIWSGRARAVEEPRTLTNIGRKRYVLQGLLESAIGYQTLVSFEVSNNVGADRVPGGLGAVMEAIVNKMMTAGRITPDATVDATSSYGVITFSPAITKTGNEWITDFAVASHTRPMDRNGVGFSMTQGPALARNRDGAPVIQLNKLLVTEADVLTTINTVRNDITKKALDGSTDYTIIDFDSRREYGNRTLELPAWLPARRNDSPLLQSVLNPIDVITIRCPRWQTNEAELALLESMSIGRTVNFVLRDGTNQIANTHAAVTRHSYSWTEDNRQPPEVLIEAVVYRHTHTRTAWRLQNVGRLQRETFLN